MSNARLHKLIQRWGGPTDTISADALAFMLANFRRGSKNAYLYQKEWHDKRLVDCPIITVVSADDPLTKRFNRNYLNWKRYAQHTHLVVLDQGKHYFVSEEAEQMASVIQYLWSHANDYSNSDQLIMLWQPEKMVQNREVKQ